MGDRGMTYYAIHRQYTGPNQGQEQYIDADYIELSTTPATAYELVIVDNDWSTDALGEFETIEQAERSLREMFNGLREVELDDNSDGDVVASYKPGLYEIITDDAAQEFIYDSLCEDITPETNSVLINSFAQDYEHALNDEWQATVGVERFEDIIRAYQKEIAG